MVELNTRSDVELWLGSQPESERQKLSIALAARASLRVLPLLRGVKRGRQAPSVTLLQLLYGQVATLFSATFPDQIVDMKPVYHASVRAIASRAAFTASALDAATAISDTTEAAYQSANYRNAAARACVARSIALTALCNDANFIDEGGIAPDLMARPLWPDGVPREIKSHWDMMQSRLEEWEDDWSVWIGWYVSRLRGLPLDMDDELSRLSVLERYWQEDGLEDPATINADIATLNSSMPTVRKTSREVFSQDEMESEAIRANIIALQEKLDEELGDNIGFRPEMAMCRHALGIALTAQNLKKWDHATLVFFEDALNVLDTYENVLVELEAITDRPVDVTLLLLHTQLKAHKDKFAPAEKVNPLRRAIAGVFS